MVNEFAKEMKRKLHEKARQGYHGWNDPKFLPTIHAKLDAHVMRLDEGQYQQVVDVVNLAVFLWYLDKYK